MKQLTINGTSWLQFQDVLAAGESFKTYGNLQGAPGYTLSTGRLPSTWRDLYWSRHAFITYTVLSYGTPIAWHDSERGWITPDVKYSTTTSKAQGRIFPACNALNG